MNAPICVPIKNIYFLSQQLIAKHHQAKAYIAYLTREPMEDCHKFPYEPSYWKRLSRDLVNKHLLQLWYIRHPVQPVRHCLSNVWEGHKLFVLLLLLLLVIVEVVLLSFFFLAAPLTIFFLLLILVFIIAFLLEVLKSVQGTLLLLTAEFLSTSLLLNTEFKCLKSRPVSERRLCTNGFIIRYIKYCGL